MCLPQTVWTLAERTTIQSLLKHEIPLAVIVSILLNNRAGAAKKWRSLRMAVNFHALVAYWHTLGWCWYLPEYWTTLSRLRY